jgi:cyanophycin synthetase
MTNYISNWGMSAMLITKEARAMGLRVDIIDREKNFFALYKKNSNKPFLVKASAIPGNGVVGFHATLDKDLTEKTIKKYTNFPIPRSVDVTRDDAKRLTTILRKNKLTFPLVVKPLDGAHGYGITVDIRNYTALKAAINTAFRFRPDNKAVLVQEYFQGDDIRLLVIGNKVEAIAKRIPAHVTGDGSHTIKELIARENSNPMRGSGDYDKPFSQIVVDKTTSALLKKQRTTMTAIPKQGAILYLQDKSNTGLGGVGVTIPRSKVHPSFLKMAPALGKLFGLAYLAVDVLVKDISKPFTKKNGVIIEINNTPSVRMPMFPYEGKSINIAKKLVSYITK